MNALTYILGNFWHFLGATIILSIVIKNIVYLVSVIIAIVLDRNVDIS